MYAKWTQHLHKLPSFGMVSSFDVIIHVLIYSLIAFSTKDTNPSPSSIQSFLSELQKLLKLYQRYDNKEHREWIELYMANMVEMLKVMQKEPESEKTTRKSLID